MYKKFDIIEIEWVDSQHTSGWIHESDYEFGLESIQHKMIGYFLNETKYLVAVVQSYCLKEYDGGHNIDSIMEIPKKFINKIKKII